MLLATCLLLASTVAAVPVNPSAPDGIAAVWLNDSWCWVLCTDGNVYRMFSTNQTWALIEDHLPAPVAVMVDWSPYFIRTSAGELWQGEPQLGSDNWQLAPAIPCAAPVPTQGNSMGGVKGLFR